MCGICGVVQGETAVPTAVGERMLRILAHRGPDDEGLAAFAHNGRHALLGSRRLAIIDLSPAGHQPMVTPDGATGLVFNGEIYNFPALRESLITQGYRFRSRTDSEVVLYGFQEHGPDFFARLDGMFALALWDGRAGRLYLARDRMGKKPLYYYAAPGLLVFGSEIKALLAHPAVPVEVNTGALPAYLVHGYVPHPATFYHGIVQVPPATYIAVDGGGVHPPATYWTLTFPPEGEESRVSVGEAAEAVRGLMGEAVRKRLISDVPLGALLSGGLDSSVVVSAMAEAAAPPVRTFTAGFEDDRSYDERPYAREVADAFGTTHREFVARPDAAALFDHLLWHHDGPYGDSSSLPTYLVSGLTRREVTVALVGDGGDEVFGGYERFRAALLAERVPAMAAAPLGAALRRLPRGQGYHSRLTRLRRFGAGMAGSLVSRYLEWVSVVPPGMAASLLQEPLGEGVEAAVAQVETIAAEARLAHPLHRLMHLNLRTYLHGDLLVKMDRMSMAQSLETRSPFLDTALMEFVAGLPAEMKIRGAAQKVVLRHAYAGRLPPTVLRRAKHGFGVPVDGWFRGPLRGRVEDELLAPDARVTAFLRPDALRRLAADHFTGREQHGHRLWSLLALEVWLRELPSWPARAGRDG